MVVNEVGGYFTVFAGDTRMDSFTIMILHGMAFYTMLCPNAHILNLGLHNLKDGETRVVMCVVLLM